MSNFVDYAALLTEIALLGNVAIRVGKRVVWDAANMRAVDLPQADQYVRRERFLGSSTVRVDGQDVNPAAGRADYGLECQI